MLLGYCTNNGKNINLLLLPKDLTYLNLKLLAQINPVSHGHSFFECFVLKHDFEMTDDLDKCILIQVFARE